MKSIYICQKYLIMKNLFITLLLLISTLSFSQETKKTLKSGEVDKRVNIKLDSLSQKHKKDIVGYIVVTRNGKKSKHITYYKNDKLYKEEVLD